MRVLMIVHGFPPSAQGGTEVYVRGLARALAAAGDHVTVLTRESDPHRPEYAVRTRIDRGVPVYTINNTFQACTSLIDSYENPDLLAVASGLIDELAPDVAHVQHLTCLSTGLLRDLSARRIPVVMTLNDYWLICQRGQLLDLDGQRCDGPYDAGCSRCLPPGVLASPTTYRAGRLARSLPVPGAAGLVSLASKALEVTISADALRAATRVRLEHMRDAAQHVDVFLAPSETMRSRFERFGIPAERLRRCDQGIDLELFRGIVRGPSTVLRAGFAGALIPSKAPHLLLRAAAELPAGSIAVDLIGPPAVYHGDGSYRDVLEPLLGKSFVRHLGPVPHERMASAMARLDVLVVPSVWIENAPFIIREAFAAGVPVIASDLGGMREMVRHDRDGLLFAPGDDRALAAQLRRLQDEPGLLERLRQGIRPPMSIQEDAGTLRRLYGELLDARPPAAARATPLVPRTAPAIPVAAVVLNYQTPEQTWLAVRSLQTSSAPPSATFIVDNGSGDGSAEALGSRLTGVTLIRSARNVGFSAGCNIGIAAALEAGAEAVLLVNSDVVLAPDALAQLTTALRERDVGIAAPILFSREEPDCIASAGIAYSPGSGRMRHLAAGQRPGALPPGRIRDADAVSGCVMLIRREVFERAGLLDPEYFFSFEDIDFCLRARAAGFRVVCATDAAAYHEGGRSIGRRSPRRVYYASRNHLRLASRTSGTLPRRIARGGTIVALNAAYVLLAPEAPLVSGMAALARGTWHHLTGRYGP